MKKYLMTWYGITDFRASLGLENSTGPILGALLAEDYSDVVVLGFTNNNKKHQSIENIEQHLSSLVLTDFSQTKNFIDTFSNTLGAHEFFLKWLQNKLLESGKNVAVKLHPINLAHLNDTQGIYEAATDSLNNVSQALDDCLVTLFLSPGTPVMAFVWAFAALKFPNLKKRLIASSQPGKKPERIVLPNEWLEWNGKQSITGVESSDQYDVVFHLFGEQRMPILLGILQLKSQQHIFVKSSRYSAHVMKQFLGKAEYSEITVNPYDPENVRSSIMGVIEDMPKDVKIGFNLTGGTKLMYAGALAACRKVNATPFYFNSDKNSLLNLNNFKTIEAAYVDSVETFILLNGNNLTISKPGHWSELVGCNSQKRNELTNGIWQNSSKITRHYKQLCEYNDVFKPFLINDDFLYVELKEDKSVRISLGSQHYEFDNWPFFAKYLTGGWLEEYVFLQLQPYLDSGLIKDLRIGLEVSLSDDSGIVSQSKNNFVKASKIEQTYQELDVVFTDGRVLYIVECKSGYFNSENVMKLQNIVRYFGGSEGRGILVSGKKPQSKVAQIKLQESNNISLITGRNLKSELEKMLVDNMVKQ